LYVGFLQVVLSLTQNSKHQNKVIYDFSDWVFTGQDGGTCARASLYKLNQIVCPAMTMCFWTLILFALSLIGRLCVLLGENLYIFLHNISCLAKSYMGVGFSLWLLDSDVLLGCST